MKGKRKLIAGAVVLATGVAVALARGDVPPNLLSLLQVLFGAFVVGNGVEHLAVARSSPQPEIEPQVEPAPASAIQAEEIKEAVSSVQQTLVTIIQKIWPQG